MCDYVVKALGYLEYEQIENMRGLQHLVVIQILGDNKQTQSVETKQYDQELG